MHRGQAYFSTLPGVDIHSRVTSQASYSPEYIPPTQKKNSREEGFMGIINKFEHPFNILLDFYRCIF
jgi:hypothetical protein